MQTFICLCLLLIFIVFHSGVMGFDEKGDNRATTTSPRESGSPLILMCHVGCSEQKKRTGYARLRWSGADITSRNIRLDFTVYEGGFEAGAFASLEIRQEQITPALGRAIEGHNIRAFDVRHTEAILSEKEGGSSSITVENLEPGLNYRWRLMTQTNEEWISSKETVCQAPICIAD